MNFSLRKIWPYLLGILFLLWLYIAFYSAKGYREVLIPAGAEEFTASFSQVSDIIPIAENVEQMDLVENMELSMTIQFTDEADGTTSRVDLQNAHIHVNGYTSVDNLVSGDLPLTLNVGHTYTVQYWAVCEGELVEGLSLALYGGPVTYWWLQITILIIVIVGTACLYRVLHGDRRETVAMLVLWCSLYVLYLLSMPLQLRDEEQTAFARSYAVSNEMMGCEVEDEDGYVYVDDIGLRNSGYLSYDVPFYRFWSNVNTKADTSRAATATYRDDGVRTPDTYYDAVAITVARQLGTSYPIIYLAGSLFAGAIALLVLGIVLARCKSVSTCYRVLSIAILPSLYSVLQLHSGLTGLFRSLESVYPWLELDEMIRRVILYITPTDGKDLMITWVPIAILGSYAWNDLHKETMPESREKALLTGMVIVSAMAALLRLNIF